MWRFHLGIFPEGDKFLLLELEVMADVNERGDIGGLVSTKFHIWRFAHGMPIKLDEVSCVQAHGNCDDINSDDLPFIKLSVFSKV